MLLAHTMSPHNVVRSNHSPHSFLFARLLKCAAVACSRTGQGKLLASCDLRITRRRCVSRFESGVSRCISGGVCAGY